MTRSSRGCLRGHVMLSFVIASTAIMLAAALAVDMVCALSAQAAQRQRLEIAKDACMASLNAIKFSDDPAAATESVIEEALARDGATGNLRVTYVELPESQTGAGRRVAGVYASLSEERQTIFGGFAGMPSVTVSSEIAWSTSPYSSQEVWRPTSTGDSTWTVALGAGTVSSKSRITALRCVAPSAAPPWSK